jgi:hypothetical protein
MKKKAILAALLAVGMFGSCLGPNKLFNQLNDWNAEATENKWANEGIFLVCNIVPVYGVAYLADIVVTNSIEWWNGDE